MFPRASSLKWRTSPTRLAKRYLQKSLQLQNGHPVVNYSLGYPYYRDRQYTKAPAYFERALDGSMDTSDGGGQEVSDDYIRQIIRRLSRDLSYWDRLFETTTVLNEATRRNVGAIKLAEGYTACIYCRVKDYLPGG